jgi:hypothetical protein
VRRRPPVWRGCSRRCEYRGRRRGEVHHARRALLAIHHDVIIVPTRRMSALRPCRGGAGCSASLRWPPARVEWQPRARHPPAPPRCSLGALVHRRRHSRRHEPLACASDGQPAAVPSPPPPAVLRSPFLTQPPPPAPSSVPPPVASWSAINGPFATGGGAAAASGNGAGGSRKAELYLVRTDGFTCTRETVTGALRWC